MSVIALEKWLTITEMADHLGCSYRWIEDRLREYRETADPLPSAMIAGRRKFRASEVEAWAERNGHLRKEGAA